MFLMILSYSHTAKTIKHIFVWLTPKAFLLLYILLCHWPLWCYLSTHNKTLVHKHTSKLICLEVAWLYGSFLTATSLWSNSFLIVCLILVINLTDKISMTELCKVSRPEWGLSQSQHHLPNTPTQAPGPCQHTWAFREMSRTQTLKHTKLKQQEKPEYGTGPGASDTWGGRGGEEGVIISVLCISMFPLKCFCCSGTHLN